MVFFNPKSCKLEIYLSDLSNLSLPIQTYPTYPVSKTRTCCCVPILTYPYLSNLSSFWNKNMLLSTYQHLSLSIDTYQNLSIKILQNCYLSAPINTYQDNYCPIVTYQYLSMQMLHHNLPIQPIQTYLNLSLAIQPHIINWYLSIPI